MKLEKCMFLPQNKDWCLIKNEKTSPLSVHRETFDLLEKLHCDFCFMFCRIFSLGPKNLWYFFSPLKYLFMNLTLKQVKEGSFWSGEDVRTMSDLAYFNIRYSKLHPSWNIPSIYSRPIWDCYLVSDIVILTQVL